MPSSTMSYVILDMMHIFLSPSSCETLPFGIRMTRPDFLLKGVGTLVGEGTSKLSKKYYKVKFRSQIKLL